MEIKKYKIKSLLLLFSAAITLYACKKETTNTSNSSNLPVVQAYLVAGKPITVNVFSQKALTDTAKFGPAIKGLKVSISDGSITLLLTQSSTGAYTYADSTFLVTGKTYTLSFNYLTYAVSAKTVMPAKPINFASNHTNMTIDNLIGTSSVLDTLVNLSWTNPDSLRSVLVFNNLDGTSFPADVRFGSAATNFELNTYRGASYPLTQRTFAYYGHYQIILCNVNVEYINLLSSNTTGSTSSSLSDQPTNVVNGVGIFTAMQADTLAFLVQ
jgi:Domain of unknown function (DUF4249)